MLQLSHKGQLSGCPAPARTIFPSQPISHGVSTYHDTAPTCSRAAHKVEEAIADANLWTLKSSVVDSALSDRRSVLLATAAVWTSTVIPIVAAKPAAAADNSIAGSAVPDNRSLSTSVAAETNSLAVDTAASLSDGPVQASAAADLQQQSDADDQERYLAFEADSDSSSGEDDDSSSSSSSSDDDDDQVVAADDNNAVGSGTIENSKSSSRASSKGSEHVTDASSRAQGSTAADTNAASGSSSNGSSSASNPSSSNSKPPKAVSANLSVQAYLQILQDSRKASWPIIAQKISAGDWIELSQVLVQPPFDDVRQACFYIPWALLQSDDFNAAVAARKAYVDFIDHVHALATIALKAADQVPGAAVQVQQSFNLLNASVDAYLSAVPKKYR